MYKPFPGTEVLMILIAELHAIVKIVFFTHGMSVMFVIVMILFIAFCAARRFDQGGVLSNVLINQIVVSESMYMLWALQFDLHCMAAMEPFSLPLFVL